MVPILFAAFALLLLGFVSLYFWKVVETPVLRFGEKENVLRWIEKCPSLTDPYRPSFWCSNPHLMLCLLLFREYRSKEYSYDKIERLKMKDGGLTGLAWSGIRNYDKKEKKPIAVVFHTISGDEQDMKSIVKHIREQLDWIVVVCIRRGHGDLPLLTPRIDTMGSTSDLKEQLASIQKKFPGSPLFGVGISAGSGLLARYLGEEGRKSKLSAAVAISPAYDIEKAFHRVHPVYSKIMGQRLINYFLRTHYQIFSRLHGIEKLLESKTLGEFQDRLHTVAGYKDKKAYYKNSNPVLVAKKIRTPLLILNAADDPICVNQNVLENLHWLESLPDTIHVHTKRGSHIAYFEGWNARSWSNRVVTEYFQAVWEESKMPKARKGKVLRRR